MRATKVTTHYIAYCSFHGNKLRVVTTLEEDNPDLAKVEVDEVLLIVADLQAKFTPYDTAPRRGKLLVELVLDVCGNVILGVLLIDSMIGTHDCFLLHVLGHAGILYDTIASKAITLRTTNIVDDGQWDFKKFSKNFQYFWFV